MKKEEPIFIFRGIEDSDNMRDLQDALNYTYSNYFVPKKKINLPKKVLFNGDKTTVLYKSNKHNQKYESTSVTCQDGDTYDKEKGVLLAYFIHTSGLSKAKALEWLERKCK